MKPTLPEIPGYDIEAEIGRGGMGVVYKAHRRDSGAVRAIKMILCNRDASFQELARFRIEAEAMACLDHPNIAKIRDVGVFSGYPFLALDFAEQGSLKQVTRGLPQPVRWSAELVATLAEAMQHAHGRGMLHRDLKPANVLMAADGSPRITDFGLVKFSAPMAKVSDACCTFSVKILDEELRRFSREFGASSRTDIDLGSDDQEDEIRSLLDAYSSQDRLPSDDGLIHTVQDFLDETRQQVRQPPSLEDLTLTGTVMGSPSYMAPEQATGTLNKIGPGTDVYALGGILHELLTGLPPITGDGYIPVIHKILTEGAPPIRRINPALPPRLESICLRCLDRDIRKRYPRASALAADLRQFLDEDSSGAIGAGSPVPTGRIAEVPTITVPVTRTSSGHATTTRRWWSFGKS